MEVFSVTEQEIVELARRGQMDPESLTLEEVRELALVVICDLNDAGENLKATHANQN
jgi:hypothetical protein